jgi:hypothetical protein
MVGDSGGGSVLDTKLESLLTGSRMGWAPCS